MLWRELLRRDFSEFPGAAGIDLLEQQENELTLSQSSSHIEWGDAPWRQFYIENFQSSNVHSLAWVSRFQTNIESRQDHAGARCGDYLVVYAGFTNDQSLYVLDTKAQVNELRACIKDPNRNLQTAKMNWSRCDVAGQGPSAQMLYGHSLDKSTLLLYGGMKVPGYSMETSDVWLLHLQQAPDNSETANELDGDACMTEKLPFRWKWEKVTVSGTIPHARAYHSAAICNKKLWIFGGTWGSRTHNDFSCLDLDTWTWESVATHGGEPPSARMGHSCTKHGTNLIFLGGSDNPFCQGGGRDYSDAYCFDTVTGIWRSLTAAPGRIIGRRHAAVSVGDCILVIAGGSPHTNSVGCLDLKSETWSMPEMQGRKPQPRVSLSAHFCNGVIFVFGGCTDYGLSRELFLLDISDSTGAIKHKRIDETEESEEHPDYRYETFDYDYDDDEDDDNEFPPQLRMLLNLREQLINLRNAE